MGNGQLCGRTGGNHTVNMDPPATGEASALIGQVVPVYITQARSHTLAGQLA